MPAIVVHGDLAVFMRSFGVADVVVAPGTMIASALPRAGAAVCVVGDEASVMVPACAYTTPTHVIPGVGMLSIDNHAWTGRLTIVLGLAMLPVQLWRYLLPDTLVLVIHPFGMICFLILLTSVLAISLFRSRRIKLDQVLGGVVLYLNIGLTFAVTYSLIEHLLPGSFELPNPVPGRPIHPSYFVYFSFVTLTTVGYGDTVPLGAAARSLSTLEAALGQLYPAIILARLVSIEVSQKDRSKPRSEHREEAAKNHRRASGDLVHEGRKVEP